RGGAPSSVQPGLIVRVPGADRELLAEHGRVRLQLLVAGDANLESAQMLGAQVRLAENAESEQREEDQKRGDREEGDEQLRSNLDRQPPDCANERVVGAAEQPPLVLVGCSP